MSALGQKQTYALQQAMSALPPIATKKADIRKMVRLPSSLYFSVLFLVPKPLALAALPNAFHYVVDLGVPEPGAV